MTLTDIEIAHLKECFRVERYATKSLRLLKFFWKDITVEQSIQLQQINVEIVTAQSCIQDYLDQISMQEIYKQMS